MRRLRPIWALFLLLGFTAPLLVAGVLPASGQSQTCGPVDPYTGQQQCTPNIHIVLSINFGPIGSTIHVKAYGFNSGDQVTGTFDGVVMFQANAKQGVGNTTAVVTLGALLPSLFHGHLAAAATYTPAGIDESFLVPNKAPGPYPVCVSGSGAQACATFTIVPASQGSGTNTNPSVLGSQFSNGNTSGNVVADVPSSSGGSGGSLARTGAEVGLLVLLGVGLVILGRYLREVAKGKRSQV